MLSEQRILLSVLVICSTTGRRKVASKRVQQSGAAEARREPTGCKVKVLLGKSFKQYLKVLLLTH